MLVLETGVIRLSGRHAGDAHHAADGHELAAEGGEEGEEGQAGGQRVLRRADQAVEPVQGLAATARGDGVQELPDVLLAPVLHRLLHELAVDPPLQFDQIGELAVLAREAGGGVGVHAARRPAAAVALLPQSAPGELGQGVGGDPHAGLPLELAGQELQTLPAPPVGFHAAQAQDGAAVLEQADDGVVRGHGVLGEHQGVTRGEPAADGLGQLREVALSHSLEPLAAGRLEQPGEGAPQLLHLLLAPALPATAAARLPPFEDPGGQLAQRLFWRAGLRVDVEEVKRLKETRGRLPLPARERPHP